MPAAPAPAAPAPGAPAAHERELRLAYALVFIAPALWTVNYLADGDTASSLVDVTAAWS